MSDILQSGAKLLINLYPSFKMHGILHDVIQTTESILTAYLMIYVVKKTSYY